MKSSSILLILFLQRSCLMADYIQCYLEENRFGSPDVLVMPTTEHTVFPVSTLTYTMTFPQALSTGPIVLSAAKVIEWSGELSFSFHHSAITASDFTLTLTNISAGLSRMQLTHIYFDRVRFARSSVGSFKYQTFASGPYAQNFSIANHEFYEISILQAFTDVIIPAQNAYQASVSEPFVTATQFYTTTIKYSSMRVVVGGNNGYYLKYVLLSLHNITSITAFTPPKNFFN